MMLSHLYPSSMLFNIIIVLIFVSAPNPVASQSVEAQIAALPACSTACLNKAATNILCGATDFVCQCANQDGIVGVLGRVSTQANCLISDCGISNATSTRKIFKNICGLLAPISSSSTPETATIGPPETDAASLQIFIPSSTDLSTSALSSIVVSSSSESVLIPISTPSTSISTLISIPTSTEQPSTSTSISISALPLQSSSQVETTFAISTATSTPTLSTADPSLASASAIPIPSSSVFASISTSTGMSGSAKMSPIADSSSNSWGTQAGTMNSGTTLTQTRTLSKGAVVGIIVAVVVVSVLSAVLGFFLWKRRKMTRGGGSGRSFVVLNEEPKKIRGGSRGGPESNSDEKRGREGEEEKALPIISHPHSDAKTYSRPPSPGLISPFADRASTMDPAFEEETKSTGMHLSVPEQTLSNATYNKHEQHGNMMYHSENCEHHPNNLNRASHSTHAGTPDSNPGSFIQRNSNYKSNLSFMPSNPNHKSAASSFFASIPIALDSREGCCEDCMDGREMYRTLVDKEAPSGSPPAVEASSSSRESSTSASRSDVQSELLVARIGSLSSLSSEERASTSPLGSLSSLRYDPTRGTLESLDELTRELSKVSEGGESMMSEVKRLKSNPFLPVAKKGTFDFGFRRGSKS